MDKKNRDKGAKERGRGARMMMELVRTDARDKSLRRMRQDNATCLYNAGLDIKLQVGVHVSHNASSANGIGFDLGDTVGWEYPFDQRILDEALDSIAREIRRLTGARVTAADLRCDFDSYSVDTWRTNASMDMAEALVDTISVFYRRQCWMAYDETDSAPFTERTYRMRRAVDDAIPYCLCRRADHMVQQRRAEAAQ